MYHGTIDRMTGTAESDETFIGGKARNMHPGHHEKPTAPGEDAFQRYLVLVHES